MPRCASRTRGQQKGAEGILRFWKERHCVRTRCYCHDFHPWTLLSDDAKPRNGDPRRKAGANNKVVQKEYHGQKKSFPSYFCTSGRYLRLGLFVWTNKEQYLKLWRGGWSTGGLSHTADAILSKMPQLLNLLVLVPLVDLTWRVKTIKSPKSNIHILAFVSWWLRSQRQYQHQNKQ